MQTFAGSIKRNLLNAEHALWAVGFRPFFILAFLSGALMPVLWALVFSGTLPWRSSFANSLQWHSHEMFFGFGWAVLGGFLLTATKNWVKIRGYHGPILMILVAAWIIERLCFFLPAGTPTVVFWLGENVFLGTILAMILRTLLKYRKEDQFPDNWYFIFALPIFIIAKNLLLNPDFFYNGWTMTLGLFRLAFIVMLERTVPQFMKNGLQTEITKRPFLNHVIKLLFFLLIFNSFLPQVTSAILFGVAGAVCLLRFFMWSPLVAFKKFEIGIMYLGYLGIAVHLFLEALRVSGHFLVVGDVSTHVFTFFAMGLIVAGMLTRISMGHTGRKLVFVKSDKVAVSAIIIAAFTRVVAPQFFPLAYAWWIAVSAAGWIICFAILGFRLVPFLLQPRVDGRIH
jgi:uncharacterized protein involved in response to NO